MVGLYLLVEYCDLGYYLYTKRNFDFIDTDK